MIFGKKIDFSIDKHDNYDIIIVVCGGCSLVG